MNKLNTILFIIFTPLAIFLLVYFFGKDLLLNNEYTEDSFNSSMSQKVDIKAKYFDLPSISNKRIKLTDFQDKPLIMFFWATWNNESMDLVKIFDDYLKENIAQEGIVKVLGVESQEDLSLGSSFVRRGGYSVPVAVDSSGSMSEDYGVNSLPTVFFIDRDGVIKEIWRGSLSVKQIVDKVEVILK